MNVLCFSVAMPRICCPAALRIKYCAFAMHSVSIPAAHAQNHTRQRGRATPLVPLRSVCLRRTQGTHLRAGAEFFTSTTITIALGLSRSVPVAEKLQNAKCRPPLGFVDICEIGSQICLFLENMARARPAVQADRSRQCPPSDRSHAFDLVCVLVGGNHGKGYL